MANDPMRQNELNYLAWKHEHAIRKRELRTQFNMWRDHQYERMCNHQLYKSESEEQSPRLAEMLQQRLEQACSCETCRTTSRKSSTSSVASSVTSNVSDTFKPRANQFGHAPS